jgi:hypothetical protein
MSPSAQDLRGCQCWVGTQSNQFLPMQQQRTIENSSTRRTLLNGEMVVGESETRTFTTRTESEVKPHSLATISSTGSSQDASLKSVPSNRLLELISTMCFSSAAILPPSYQNQKHEVTKKDEILCSRTHEPYQHNQAYLFSKRRRL